MLTKKTKKILITILSLTLLFYIGCDNENKTGGGGVSPTSPESDIDKQIKAFLDSVPNHPTKQHANDLEDSSFKGELDGKIQFVGEPEDNETVSFTLEITKDKATLKRADVNPTGILNEQIYIYGNKYFCRVDDDDIEYIEFDKPFVGGKITSFKYIEIGITSSKSNSYIETYTGTLTKQ